MTNFKKQVIQEIKALRDIGVNVSDKAEQMAFREADEHEHMNVTDYVDMCVMATA